jgi:uncharacterized membrane protein
MKTISHHFLAMVICIAAFFLGTQVLFFKYYYFGFNDWDFTIFAQSMWNLLHGTQYTSLYGINFFGDHAYFITLLILPLFALFPHPLTLLFLKLTAFIVSAYLLYRILRTDLGGRSALLLMVLYLCFPANIFALLYEFNVEAFAPVFLLLMFDFFRKGKFGPYLAAAVFLCLIKENMLLIVMAFSAYALLSKKKDPFKWGWAPAFISILLFLILVVAVVPFFREASYASWTRYQYIFDDPLRAFFLIIFSPAQREYVFGLFGPLLLPSLISPQNLFFISPVFFQHLLSANREEHTIFYHYGATMAPFIFLAAADTLKKIRFSLNERIYRGALSLLVVAALAFTFSYQSEIESRLQIHSESFTRTAWAMIKEVPPQEGVVTTFSFLPALSMRKSLYSFHMIYEDRFQEPSMVGKGDFFKSQVFRLPDDVSYALIDWNDDWMVKALAYKPEYRKRIDLFLKDWVIIKQHESVVLLRKLPLLEKSMLTKGLPDV